MSIPFRIPPKRASVSRFRSSDGPDPQTIAGLATYEQPRRHPSGVEYVLVNGRIAVDAGVQRDVRPGRVLRHGAGR